MQLILWPAVITLAITLLRLTGELQGWSPMLFNAEAGGGGALVGISWLPFLLGPYFAWKLAKAGKGPRSGWAVAGLGLLGMLLMMGLFAGVQALGLGTASYFIAYVVGLALAFLPWKAWSELSRTLLAYALAARIPVAIIMLLAIYGNWGTHYDVLPPDPPASLAATGPFMRWVLIGLLPQMTIWIAFTVLVGALVGGVVVALGKPRPASPSA